MNAAVEWARQWQYTHVPPEQTYICAFRMSEDSDVRFYREIENLVDVLLLIQVSCGCGEGHGQDDLCWRPHRDITRWRLVNRVISRIGYGATIYYEPEYHYDGVEPH